MMYMHMTPRYIPSLLRLHNVPALATRGLRCLSEHRVENACGCQTYPARNFGQLRQQLPKWSLYALNSKRWVAAQATDGEVTEAVAVAGDWLEAQKLDIRVGRVVSVELHPDADSLYVEEVDVGEEAPRTIISGLVEYVPIESMQDRPVIVLCNLKPRNMRGIKSNGMLLCASNDAHTTVEPLTPPEGSNVGERVAYGDDETATQPEPESPNKVQKKKIWEAVQPDLRTNEDKQVIYKGTVMTTGAGPVTTQTLANASIS